MSSQNDDARLKRQTFVRQNVLNRLASFALLLLLASSSIGADRAKKDSGRWSISSGHSVVWNGNREVLAGLRIDGSPDSIKSALGLGFKDFCVDLSSNSSANWEPSLTALEGANSKYLISINSLAPMADAYAVDPEGYRVPGITSARHISVHIPGATSVLAVLALSIDGTVQWNKVIPTPNGQLELDVDPDSDLDHILLLYPRLSSSDLLDCWDGFDEARDNLLAELQRSKPGPGCRGIVNPVGASARLFGSELDAIPTSTLFQLQFRSYIESRYHSVDTAINAWSMRSSSADSFDRLARMVPLWVGEKGIPGLWDPSTNEIIPVDSRHSQFWEDVKVTIYTAARARFRHLVAAIHDLSDVPVIQEWNGWSLPYEGTPNVDGVGLVTDGVAPSTLLEEAGRGASSIMRWNRQGWLIASRIQGVDQSSATEMQAVVDDLASIGTRGFFLQSTNSEALKKWSGIVKTLHQTPPPDDAVVPLYFPENAFNPAQPQALPGGIFWLPSPDAGDRLDLGSKIHGYSMGTFDTQRVVLWAPYGSGTVRLKLQQPKRATVKNGAGVVQPVKVGKDFIDVTLSPDPIVIYGINEIPVPEISILETSDRVDQLLALAEASHRDVTSEAFIYHDGQSSLDRGPGAAYLSMRKAYNSLSTKLADYTWIEAESAKNYTLGQAKDVSGCSNGRAFSVRSELSLPGQIYRVELPVRSRSTGEQEVWVAAKIAPADRGKVKILFGSQALSLLGSPTGAYGDGFAWYKCGVTRLGAEPGVVAIEIDGSNGVDAVFDAVLLTPRAFTPNGVFLPDAVNYVEPEVGKKKPSRKKG